jgi:uncharacterized membrane protein YccC
VSPIRKRKQDPSTNETIIVDRRLYAVLCHLGARLTSLEQALARLQNNTAATPKRTRKPKSAEAMLG